MRTRRVTGGSEKRKTKTRVLAVPTHQELLDPTIRAMHHLGGSASVAELNDEVAALLKLPVDVLEVPRTGIEGSSLFEYHMAWARNYLKNAGLLVNSERGVWALSPRGQDTASVNPAEIVRIQRKKFQKQSAATGIPPLTSAATEAWQEHLLNSLLKLTPAAFERLSQRLLRESGFIHVEVTGRTGDGGIDGHGIIRLQGLVTFPVVFQCKRYRGSVGPSIVRELRGAMEGRADRGLLITTGTFTREARMEATRPGARPIDLVDGELLLAKLRELRLGVRIVEVVEVDSDFFSSI